MGAIGEIDYRNGAQERLIETFLLPRSGRFGGSIYLAGRAVEGILRAVIWRSDSPYATGRKTLDTGHDLRELLKLVRNLGVLHDQDIRESLSADVRHVARLWQNDMRFWPTTRVKRDWFAKREIGGKRTIQRAAQQHYDACSRISKRCETLWKN